MTPSDLDDVQTAYVGRFDPLEIPIILEVLAEHGIFAMTKSSLEEPDHHVYPFLNDDRGSLLVDRERIDEAKKLIAEEVPRRVAELGHELDAEGVPVSLVDKVPFGWFEPAVARVLLELFAEVDVGAAPEYPLDQPAPAYARADGRVRIHVEEILLDEAEDLLAKELPEALAARGIAFTEPLRGADES